MSVHTNGEDPLAAFEQELAHARHDGPTDALPESHAGGADPGEVVEAEVAAERVATAADRVQAAVADPAEPVTAEPVMAEPGAARPGVGEDGSTVSGPGAPSAPTTAESASNATVHATEPGATEPPLSEGASEAPRVAEPLNVSPPAVVLERAPVWQRGLETAGRALVRWVVRPRVRLTLLGGLLVVLGVFAVSSALWSLVLGVVGAIMVVTAWLGHRLNGQVGVSWGHQGADFTFRFHVDPAQTIDVLPALPSAGVAGASAAIHEAIPEVETVEGEAHTIEIDVEELKALIAAAEAAEAAVSAAASTAAASTPVIRALRTERSTPARP